MQENRAVFAMSHQNSSISRFITPMNLKLVAKFNRLQALQLFRRKFFLEMLGNNPKFACKKRLAIRYDFQIANFACIKLKLHNQANSHYFSP